MLLYFSFPSPLYNLFGEHKLPALNKNIDAP